VKTCAYNKASYLEVLLTVSKAFGLFLSIARRLGRARDFYAELSTGGILRALHLPDVVTNLVAFY
jgi:hypothetical protein